MSDTKQNADRCAYVYDAYCNIKARVCHMKRDAHLPTTSHAFVAPDEAMREDTIVNEAREQSVGIMLDRDCSDCGHPDHFIDACGPCNDTGGACNARQVPEAMLQNRLHKRYCPDWHVRDGDGAQHNCLVCEAAHALDAKDAEIKRLAGIALRVWEHAADFCGACEGCDFVNVTELRTLAEDKKP